MYVDAFRSAVDYVARGAECRVRVLLAGGTTRIEDVGSLLAAPQRTDARFNAVDRDRETYWLGRIGQPVRIEFEQPVYLVGVHVIAAAEGSLARPDRVQLTSKDPTSKELTLADDSVPSMADSHFVAVCREVEWFDFTVASARGDSRQAAIADLEFEVPRR